MASKQRQSRLRKLGKNTPQIVLKESDFEREEYLSLLNVYAGGPSGVDAGEEKEYHLQAALKAATNSNAKEAEEIPAPPAEECKDIDYESLYSLLYHKPATYIRTSQTVEECTGVQYNMTTEDDVFLKAYNQKKPQGVKCSEDDFEKLMEIFEDKHDSDIPFASVDGTILPFDDMKTLIAMRFAGRALPCAKDVFDFWKGRRQAADNHPLQPKLKEEVDQNKDDSDPYVCFRRRDVRQTRKTRARDTQSVEKLKKLRRELEEANWLVTTAHDREVTKQQFVQLERNIFMERAKVKEAKIRLGIKTDDDDLLVNQRPQKRKIADFSQPPRLPGSQVRFPGNRPESKALDVDLLLLSDVMAQKENTLQTEIEEKAQQHRNWNQDHVDLTREPLSPAHGQGSDMGFRPATAQYQYLMTPPSSVTSESFDHPSPAQEKQEAFFFRSESPPPEDELRGQPAYRRRIGRAGRLWIDRRGMTAPQKVLDTDTSDRWKYDQDDDDEQPVYEMDPYDTKALRFRATIPMLAHTNPQTQRPRQDERTVQHAGTTAVSSPNRAAVTGQTVTAQAQPQAVT
ncbi:related to YMR164c and Gal11p [Rhynchosporium agropyri]|uniref:Enhancer of polycomb-like protein n=1 Tax=Rhynchosporium agropyri TaxID=914238 RepID=A0A1E1LT76_9HELO|nr:related to YMR164c and Gal11p [Rhynchosporium agropyri]